MPSPDTSMVFLLLKTQSHRHAVDCWQNCWPWASPIVSFSSAIQKLIPDRKHCNRQHVA